MTKKTHKAQHYVPRSYLSAWVDPATPNGYEPYVWTFPIGGGKGKNKSPYKIFTETDIYTITKADGERDLKMEHGLSDLETWFADIRTNFLEKRKHLPLPRRVKLVAFAAALKARTPKFRENFRVPFQRAYDIGQQMESAAKVISLDERKKLSRTSISSRRDKEGMTMQQVKHFLDQPFETLLPATIEACTPIMSRMLLRVLCTDSKVGFITSDHPVVWFDPQGYTKPFMLRYVGLSTPSIEITLPISPRQVLLFTHPKTFSGEPEPVKYIDVPDNIVHEINRRTHAYCDKKFVVRENYTHPYWFYNVTEEGLKEAAQNKDWL